MKKKTKLKILNNNREKKLRKNLTFYFYML